MVGVGSMIIDNFLIFIFIFLFFLQKLVQLFVDFNVVVAAVWGLDTTLCLLL